MSNKLNLDVHTLYEKEFNTDFKGYSPLEVDTFLDLIIQDYQTYQELLSELNQKVSEMERTNASLRAKLIEAQGKARSYEESPTSNLDIIKRISRLEQEVFNTNK
ncbi:MAG: DivIVA domain-containing protein [Erysipelotrichaceae bacterium]|jgi:DivIVA domain-containing protein|nr:DivIVA domain-containing protein [Bacillota bacterium]NLP22818.1 DivIVA domain-containing protein [Erysipelotrichaceae bacterium]HCY06323.1 cell division protein DivIVA [Erysipelotrichaceae bacterium]